MSRSAMVFALIGLFCMDIGCAESTGGQGADAGADIDSGSDAGADSDSDSDSDGGADSGTADSDAGEQICAESDIEIIVASPQLMIILDMSNSMILDDDMQPLPEPTKWTQAKNALANLLVNFADEIDFGFDNFPNDLICGVGAPCVFDTQPNNAENIIEILDAVEPKGGTPLYLAMKRFTESDYASTFTSGKATSYLVIISDGADTCGVYSGSLPSLHGASAYELSDLTGTLLGKELKTFVIGFGQGVDPDQLSAIAAAGGTDLTTFMDAQDQEELDEALGSIAENAVSCVYEIAPPNGSDVDMDKVDIYFDGEPVGLDPFCALEIGWTWVDDDKTMVKFCEAACRKIKDGLVEDIQIMYGCLPEPVVQ
jgi:hypothetical protein